ncbi:MAG: hypothetical protein K8R50_11470 [Betaproteobacteria bacterium]|nr:hypothetical protein [Betaproteobacteria bacterium]
MSFDQLLLSGEFQTREFKTSFETDRLLEADLEQAVINKVLSILLELGKEFVFIARQICRILQ